MPTYTYKCTACEDVIEKRQSFSDPPLTTCEQCGGALRKVIHPVGIVFKGSGWYITDSRSSNSANGPTSDTKSETKTDSGTKTESSSSSKSKSSDSSASDSSSSSTTSTSTSTSSSSSKSD